MEYIIFNFNLYTSRASLQFLRIPIATGVQHSSPLRRFPVDRDERAGKVYFVRIRPLEISAFEICTLGIAVDPRAVENCTICRETVIAVVLGSPGSPCPTDCVPSPAPGQTDVAFHYSFASYLGERIVPLLSKFFNL